jgi:hypothetical protein
MSDQPDHRAGETAPRAPDARQDRLKLALRENLKRRKAQARERGKAQDAPSDDGEACPHGELGKRGE